MASPHGGRRDWWLAMLMGMGGRLAWSSAASAVRPPALPTPLGRLFFDRHRRRCHTPTQQDGQWVRPAHPSASACPSTANNHRRPVVGAHPPRQLHEGRSFPAGTAARPPGRPPACPPTCPSVRPADQQPGRPAACAGQGAPRRWYGAPTEGGGGGGRFGMRAARQRVVTGGMSVGHRVGGMDAHPDTLGSFRRDTFTV